MGHQSKFLLDAVNVAVVSDSVILRRQHVEPEGIFGSRGKPSENVREGTRVATGQIVMEPGPLWLQTILKLAMGAFSAPNATLEETVPTFTFVADRVTKVFTYANAKVNKLELRASRGQPLRATLDIVAPDESVGAAGSGSFGAISTQQPLMLHDCAATLLGVGSRVVDDVIITIENNLLTEDYFNSQTLVHIPEGMRKITLACRTPWDATHSDLYNPTVAGIAAVLAFTNGTIGSTFTFGKWQIPPETPQVTGRDGEIYLQIAGDVRKDGSTKELAVAIDNTP
jgi:hypothetical protein